MKNVCQKFGVFANIIEERVQLTTPFNWKCVDEQLEVMFPGLSDRIHSRNDPIVRKSHVNLNRDRSKSHTSTSHYDLMLKTPFDSDDMPEKRYKSYMPSSFINNEHVSSCKEDLGKCMQNITGIMSNVFDLNIKLDEKLKDLEKEHEAELKVAQQKQAYLSAQLSRFSTEMENKIEFMKREHYLEIFDLKEEHAQNLQKVKDEAKEKWQLKLKNQLQLINEAENEISLLKAKHEEEIARYEAQRKQLITESYELIIRKNEEKDRAVAEAQDKCWNEYMAQIEDAKGKKYCVACGTGKPLDLFYVCSMECQRRYW